MLARAENVTQMGSDKDSPDNWGSFAAGALILGEIIMKASILPCLKLFGFACVLALSTPAAVAQSESNSQSAAKPQAAAKAGDKSGEGAKKKPAKPAGPAGYATEGEARTHCKGEVVWVDKDHFHHYSGSREYGRKPGAYTCDKG
jgi:hypothetical protein